MEYEKLTEGCVVVVNHSPHPYHGQELKYYSSIGKTLIQCHTDHGNTVTVDIDHLEFPSKPKSVAEKIKEMVSKVTKKISSAGKKKTDD